MARRTVTTERTRSTVAISLVLQMSSRAPAAVASPATLCVTARTTVVTALMRWSVRRPHVVLVSSRVETHRASRPAGCVMMTLTARISQMSPRLVAAIIRHHQPSVHPVRCSAAQESVFTRSGGVMETLTARTAATKPTVLYALVDQISSNVMTATVSWAASSVTASETAPMERTKSAVKT